jgi:hypothetical protein
MLVWRLQVLPLKTALAVQTQTAMAGRMMAMNTLLTPSNGLIQTAMVTVTITTSI